MQARKICIIAISVLKHLLLRSSSEGLCPDLLLWQKNQLILHRQVTIKSACAAR